MTPVDYLVCALAAAPLLYVAARIVFSAYFRAKLEYQRRLLFQLETRGANE